MRRIALIVLTLVGAQGVPVPAQQTRIQWWVAPSAVKVRPADPTPGNPQKVARIAAARNEFESFQIVMKSPAQLANLDAEASDLRNSRGGTIGDRWVEVYFVGNIAVKTPSRKGGGTGEWPDPLIPRVDAYYRQRRNAFPFALAAGNNQAIWIEIYVPQDTPAGEYLGEVRITTSGKPLLAVPVELTVWDFSLPSTSSFVTSFGFSGLSALKAHAGQYTSDEELLRLTNVYAKSALLHRISLHGGSQIPPPATFSEDRASIKWKGYDAEVGPFLNGTVLEATDPLPGAEFTSIEIRTHSSANTDHRKMLYWREWARHFQEKGWLDRLFHYVRDEPTPADFPLVTKLAKLARDADRRIRNLLTLARTETFDGLIDIWTPLINCFETKPGFDPFCKETVPRSRYESTDASKGALWWYQSCASHGCNIEGGPYFQGWPSYMIDDNGVANRMMPWLAWRYGISGELYFNVNEAYGGGRDPWSDVLRFGGNGDGTLYYPGTTARIGGRDDIPIESIRLKLIRDGLEDYEYFVLLSRFRTSKVVDGHVQRIVRNAFTFEADADLLYAERQAMAAELNNAAGRSGDDRQ